MGLKKALFFDRDGTLMEDMGWLNDPKKVYYLPGSVEALGRAQRAGFLLVMITNQSGIARGIIRPDQLEAIHQKIRRELADQGVHLDGIEFCPHHSKDGCACRKPKPLMIERACEKLAIEPTESFMVGDKVADVFCGFESRVRGSILVKTGYGEEHLESEDFQKHPPDHVAEDFAHAVDWILSQK